MPILSTVASAGVFLWGLLKIWGYAFFISVANKNTVWIIAPIWISWFFAEFFQEKEGTSFGNAISNGVIPFWVGIDWMRQLTYQLVDAHAKFTGLILGKFAICALVIAYGTIVIILGIRGKEFIRYFGRIRVITYILAVLTPFIYGLIVPDYKYFLSAVLFFPLFYFLVELIDRWTPKPKIYEKDKGGKAEDSLSGLDEGFNI